ncbi:vWA domain-containing protein [Ornithinimicrobium panacihumi]|uniref:vWA domain-containing protein n=1 Tax=Ornithinimicrobium panacihumi TaxID=2008449 RepID=UPI003F8AB08D
MRAPTRTTPHRRVFAALAAMALLTASASAAVAGQAEESGSEDGQLLLLLDASRSMEDADGTGAPKIEAAKTALEVVIGDLDPGQSVGLRVFGGSVPLDRPMADKCTDSELAVPIGTDNADELLQGVEDYMPLGETPIAHALQEAAEDLGDEGNRTILLVSDGIATCDPDPCEVAEQLTEDGLDLVVHTVGLGADEATRTQLQCIAENAGGTYFDADDAETLTTALTRISTRAFRPFSISGTPVEGSRDVADAPQIGPGMWTDTIANRERVRKHYAVERTVPGSRIYVGATMRPSRPAGLSAINLRLETPDGQTCAMTTGMVWSGGMSNSFGSAGTSSADYADDGCAEAETIIASIEAQGGSKQILDQPIELRVEELGPAQDEELLPGEAPDPEWSGLEPGTVSEEIVGGASFHDAAPIEPGKTYGSDLLPGEIAFFRVPVDYGQGLEAIAESPVPDKALAELMGPSSDVLDIAIYSPQRAEVHDVLAETGANERAVLSGAEAGRAAAVMPEVRWSNRHPADDPTVAGDYVVAVSLSSSREEPIPLGFTITADTVGDPDGEPTFVGAGTSAGTTDDEQATDGQGTNGQGNDSGASPAVDDAAETEAPAADVGQTTEPTSGEGTTAGNAADGTGDGSQDEGISPVVWVLGGLGVLLGAAGAVLLGRR